MSFQDFHNRSSSEQLSRGYPAPARVIPDDYLINNLTQSVHALSTLFSQIIILFSLMFIAFLESLVGFLQEKPTPLGVEPFFQVTPMISSSDDIIPSPDLFTFVCADCDFANLPHSKKDLLVGVELNPGPSMVLITNAAAQQARRQQQINHASSGLQGGKGKKKRNRRKKGKGTQSGPNIRQPSRSRGLLGIDPFDYEAYKRVLSDPWNNPPVRLGGENMQATGLATLIWRGAYVLPNTYASLVFYPRVYNPLLVSTQIATPYSYSNTASWQSANALAGLAAGLRTVAAGMRVWTMSSATQDSGELTLGNVARDDMPVAASNNTVSGFPWVSGTATATQGYNEFTNYLTTDTFPLRLGASAVWRPEDPIDFEFRYGKLILSPNSNDVGPTTPTIVCGLSGAYMSSTIWVDLVWHCEYTVNTGATGVINTGMGMMSTQDNFSAAKSVFGSIVSTAFGGIIGGLTGGPLGALGGAISGLQAGMAYGSTR